jgi:hypothetical protein
LGEALDEVANTFSSKTLKSTLESKTGAPSGTFFIYLLIFFIKLKILASLKPWS